MSVPLTQLNTRIVVLVLMLLLPAARAVDMVDYNRQMSHHYLEVHDLEKASGFIADGLAAAPGDSDFLDMQKVLKSEQKKGEDQKRAEEKKAQKEKTRQETEEKKSEVQLDSSMLCLCRKYEAKLQSAMNSEREVGATSGFVDKVKLHSLGVQLKAVRDYERHLEQSGQSGKCARKFDQFEQVQCINRAAQFATDQASK